MLFERVEINTITGFQYNHFLAEGQFHGAFNNHVKLLSLVRVLGAFLAFRQRVDLHDLRVNFPAAEAAGQTLVAVVFPSVGF